MSHYDLLEELGRGGMGVVYRARDTKLGREVAIKVLPETFANASRRARFAREAKLLASLNHPNIAAIYGLEESDGVHYLVLELVPGQTLADKLKHGALSMKEVLAIAQQVGDALDAAHEQGVIHRDLKPANIMITPEGLVKVLDFGLAKAFSEAPSGESLAESPTLSAMATAEGAILGTAPYMSPEQARAKPVDKRSDIFSFGLVLYEMLTGQKAFWGEEVSEILASVLKSEPDWSLLPASTDPKLRALLLGCLRKDRRERRRDIGNVKAEIAELLAGPAPEKQELAQAAPVDGKRVMLVALGASLIIGILASVVTWNLKIAPPGAVAHLELLLPPNQELAVGRYRAVALSPDGKHLVYASFGETNQLYLRTLDQTEATPIRGTERGRNPFFSPDGEWLGFWAGGELRKVPIEGGAPVILCEVASLFGASWADEDTIVFGQGPLGIWQVSANGGEPELLVSLEEGKAADKPQILPGKAVLFTRTTGRSWNASAIVVQSFETGEQRVLIENGGDGRYLPTGHLVYAVGSAVRAVPFDLARLTVEGGAVPVLENVSRALELINSTAHFSFSDSGTLVHVPANAAVERELVWVDRDGKATSVTDERRNYATLRSESHLKAIGWPSGSMSKTEATSGSMTLSATASRASPSREATAFLSGRPTASGWCSPRFGTANRASTANGRTSVVRRSGF
ncbi:MAG: serine/threonine protein kinase [Acidobacteria bacterium]|nr:MAG: serine/threonine protein kinase [Acidobacteriota bacterium]